MVGRPADLWYVLWCCGGEREQEGEFGVTFFLWACEELANGKRNLLNGKRNLLNLTQNLLNLTSILKLAK